MTDFTDFVSRQWYTSSQLYSTENYGRRSLTVNERLECRNLVAEAKQKEAEDSSGGILVSGTWHSRENENCADKSQASYTSKDSIKASSITDKGPFGETY